MGFWGFLELGVEMGVKDGTMRAYTRGELTDENRERWDGVRKDGCGIWVIGGEKKGRKSGNKWRIVDGERV